MVKSGKGEDSASRPIKFLDSKRQSLQCYERNGTRSEPDRLRREGNGGQEGPTRTPAVAWKKKRQAGLGSLTRGMCGEEKK